MKTFIIKYKGEVVQTIEHALDSDLQEFYDEAEHEWHEYDVEELECCKGCHEAKPDAHMRHDAYNIPITIHTKNIDMTIKEQESV